MADQSWLPELVVFDWNQYQESLDRAYSAFLADFAREDHRPRFQGRRLGLKRHPELDGKSATFWHFITEGKVEADRTPDRERIERIRWPRALIEETGGDPPRVNVWCTQRGQAKRWLIALDDFTYLVILDDRGDYLLPWTAYTVNYEHQRAKLRKEWEAWSKALKG